VKSHTGQLHARNKSFVEFLIQGKQFLFFFMVHILQSGAPLLGLAKPIYYSLHYRETNGYYLLFTSLAF